MKKTAVLMALLLAGGVFLMVFAGGCASSPASRFYTLPSQLELMPGQEVDLAGTRLLVGLLPVRLAPYLNGPQIITRVGESEVYVDEFNRWGVPLADGIAAVLAQGLLKDLPGTYVDVHPFTGSGVFDCQVFVDVHRFDGLPGETATLVAEWSVVRGRSKESLIARKISVYRQEAGGSDYPALVQAMAELVIQLARDVSAAIRSAGLLPDDSSLTAHQN
jgi:uncharacterized protein